MRLRCVRVVLCYDVESLLLAFACCVVTSVYIMLVWFFFFQAEDGIRDLVRSRGLGDVYKRQIMQVRIARSRLAGEPADVLIAPRLAQIGLFDYHPVSYTHLTLPTGDLA